MLPDVLAGSAPLDRQREAKFQKYSAKIMDALEKEARLKGEELKRQPKRQLRLSKNALEKHSELGRGGSVLYQTDNRGRLKQEHRLKESPKARDMRQVKTTKHGVVVQSYHDTYGRSDKIPCRST